MKTAIQHILTEASEIKCIYGFGSYFRSNTANDVDLVVVIADQIDNPGEAHKSIESLFFAIGNRLELKFDLTVLLESEFKQELLLEQDHLIEIAKK